MGATGQLPSIICACSHVVGTMAAQEMAACVGREIDRRAAADAATKTGEDPAALVVRLRGVMRKWWQNAPELRRRISNLLDGRAEDRDA